MLRELSDSPAEAQRAKAEAIHSAAGAVMACVVAIAPRN
jgi:hypothetical protein